MSKSLEANGVSHLNSLLMEYVQHYGSGTQQTALRDVLTDLRHVAETLNLNFDFALEGSEEVFNIEHDSME